MPDGIKSEKALEFIKKSFNVKDHYKEMDNESIRADLASKHQDFMICMIDCEKDINLGSLVRHANAFGAKEVIYMSGSKKFDTRGATGAVHYTNTRWIQTVEELKAFKPEYSLVAMELVAEAENIYDFSWPKKCIIVLGSESHGLTQEILHICDYKVYIPIDRGSIRSCNVSTTGSIAMYSYQQQYR